MDKTIVGFKATHPDFVKTYTTNRIIIDPSKTTTTLKGQIINSKDKSPISKAIITIEKTEIKVNTNEKGGYEIKPITAGSYTVQVMAENYTAKEQTNINVKLGQINKLDIILDPA